jgi:hypothetical protein
MRGLADEARNALAQGFVPALHVPGLPGLLVDTAVSLLREHRHVGLPEVAKAVALAVSPRHPLPAPGRRPRPSRRRRPDLVGPPAHRCSGPALVPTPPHERPGLVKLDHIKGFTL